MHPHIPNAPLGNKSIYRFFFVKLKILEKSKSRATPNCQRRCFCQEKSTSFDQFIYKYARLKFLLCEIIDSAHYNKSSSKHFTSVYALVAVFCIIYLFSVSKPCGLDHQMLAPGLQGCRAPGWFLLFYLGPVIEHT